MLPLKPHQYDVIIIGAGAAGLMCAIEAGKRGRRVLVLDKANKIGSKILISGGGRCNFTNLHIEPAAYLSGNPHFCKSALARYTQWDFIALMEKYHLSWQEKKLGQLFCDDKAPAVVKMLRTECQQAGVTIKLNCHIERITAEHGYQLDTKTDQYQCTSLVIATGGPSIPKMGSTDFGLRVAKQFHIPTHRFRPALVPFSFSPTDIDRYFKGLSGIAIDAVVTSNSTSFRENILITHRGISGPACLQASSYWQKGEPIHINLLPDLNATQWLLTQQQTHGKSALKTILSKKLPKRLAHRLAQVLTINLSGLPLGQIKQSQLNAFGQALNGWSLYPDGTEGMRTAEVSLGGVDTHALSSKTMQANGVPNLYFVGETVDVTGWLGGYNFQWAWSSGWVAGQVV